MIVSCMCMLISYNGWTYDRGFFRTVPSTTPARGILRLSNTSLYSDIPANNVLVRTYGVKDPRIFTSVSEIEVGVTDWLALSGSIPYYDDMFTQGNRSGDKTGAGDVVIGFRLSRRFENAFRGMSIGGRYRIPEQMGYGTEPLGFRTFSWGESAFSIETAADIRFKRFGWTLSASLLNFPSASPQDTVFTKDRFYDTGFGYIGIGQSDESGLSAGIFQNQFLLSSGMDIPITRWFSGLLECNATVFTEQPKRQSIISLAPGIRLGTVGGVNMSAAVDYALRGPVSSRTVMVRFRIPTLSPGAIRKILVKKRVGDVVRSRNSLVALQDFTKSDMTFMYEEELKRSLQDNLRVTGFMEVVPGETVERVFSQQKLVPYPERPHQLGIRLGANYLINATILAYRVDRKPSFMVPYLIRLPQTAFSLTASSSVTNLATGETHELGVITARVTRPRGVNFFTASPTTDLIYLSEPDRRKAEKELIDRWVDEFNAVLGRNISIFGWKPRRTEIKGEIDTEG